MNTLKHQGAKLQFFLSFCQYCRGVCFFNLLIIGKCRFHYMDLVPVFDCIAVSILLFFSVLIIRSCLMNSGRLLLIQSLFCLSILITSRSILTAAPSKNTQYPPTDYKFYNWSNLHITDQLLGQSNLTSLRLSRTMYTQQNFTYINRHI